MAVSKISLLFLCLCRVDSNLNVFDIVRTAALQTRHAVEDLKDYRAMRDWLGSALAFAHGVLDEVVRESDIDHVELKDVGDRVNPLPDLYFRFFPVYIASAKLGSGPIDLNGTCFSNTAVSAVLNANATLTVTVLFSQPFNRTCQDSYLIATVDGVALVNLAAKDSLSGVVVEHIPVNAARPGASSWVDREGARVFRFIDPDPLTIVQEALATVSLYIPSLTVAPLDAGSIQRNMEFAEGYAGIVMSPMARTLPADVPDSTFQSGDILAIFRPDGLATLEMWGTGAYTSHLTMFLWGQGNETGNLYIVESTDATADWPNPNIQKTLWEDWIPMAMYSNYSIAHLRLSDASRASFDLSKAWDFANTQIGLPYGYWNFIMTFFDTERDNLPYPATPELLEIVFAGIDKFAPAVVSMLFGQALNNRLGPAAVQANLTFLEAINVAAGAGMTFGQFVAMPELDSYVYTYEPSLLKPGPFLQPTGPSAVCDVFVCKMFRAAGMLGNVGSSINCGEFHNADVYTLGVFNSSGWESLPAACGADAAHPWCQVMGPMRMELPHFNSIAPYAHMAEHCPSLPTAYTKPAGC